MPRWWAKHGLVYWNKWTSKTDRPPVIIRNWNDDLMLGKVVKTSTIGVGQVPCVQVSVTRNEYNKFFHLFFPASTNYWALDDRKAAGADRLCSLGDMVLVRKLLEPFTLKVTHRIEKRVFEHGNIVDPLSGKRIFGPQYEELRKVRTDVVNQVVGKRLTARQLAATKLRAKQIEEAK